MGMEEEWRPRLPLKETLQALAVVCATSDPDTMAPLLSVSRQTRMLYAEEFVYERGRLSETVARDSGRLLLTSLMETLGVRRVAHYLPQNFWCTLVSAHGTEVTVVFYFGQFSVFHERTATVVSFGDRTLSDHVFTIATGPGSPSCDLTLVMETADVARDARLQLGRPGPSYDLPHLKPLCRSHGRRVLDERSPPPQWRFLLDFHLELETVDRLRVYSFDEPSHCMYDLAFADDGIRLTYHGATSTELRRSERFDPPSCFLTSPYHYAQKHLRSKMGPVKMNVRYETKVDTLDPENLCQLL